MRLQKGIFREVFQTYQSGQSAWRTESEVSAFTWRVVTAVNWTTILILLLSKWSVHTSIYWKALYMPKHKVIPKEAISLLCPVRSFFKMHFCQLELINLCGYRRNHQISTTNNINFINHTCTFKITCSHFPFSYFMKQFFTFLTYTLGASDDIWWHITSL